MNEQVENQLSMGNCKKATGEDLSFLTLKSSENKIRVFQRKLPEKIVEKPIQEKNKNTIKLLTYNFFIRPPPIKTNEDDYKSERLEDFLSFLPNFDIICFQELFCLFSERKHKIILEAKKIGFKYFLTSKLPSFFSKYLCDNGLLLLSKYPIIENDYYPYFLTISGDSVGEKGVLFAKIKIGKNFLFLFNTHLQSSSYEESQKKFNNTVQTRTYQTEELINFIYNKLLLISKNEVQNGKIILAGDLNIDAHDNYFAKQKFKLPKYSITEYKVFKKKLSKLGKINDLMLKKYNEHLYTFGNNDKLEYDHVLTGKVDLNSKQTLDYIWEIIPDYNLNIYKKYFKSNNQIENLKNDNNEIIEVLYDSFTVEKFLVQNRKYQQLSDHFGLSVELVISINK